MELAVNRKAPQGDAGTAAARRFGKYRKEHAKPTRERIVRSDPMLARMMGAWDRLRTADEMNWGNLPEKEFAYRCALAAAKDLDYAPHDVLRLSIVLGSTQDADDLYRFAGLFLSALVNSGKDEAYILQVHTYDEAPRCLGYRNRKNLTVLGDGGGYIGERMEAGELVVEGDTKTAGTFMRGGSIRIKGDAGVLAGNSMRGGEIIIEGDAQGYAGCGMEGGRIDIGGDAGTGAGVVMCGGEIRIRGNAGEELGMGMKGGLITVACDAGDGIGCPHTASGEPKPMSGGEIRIDGRIGSISDEIRCGRIYHRGKLIADK